MAYFVISDTLEPNFCVQEHTTMINMKFLFIMLMRIILLL